MLSSLKPNVLRQTYLHSIDTTQMLRIIRMILLLPIVTVLVACATPEPELLLEPTARSVQESSTETPQLSATPPRPAVAGLPSATPLPTATPQPIIPELVWLPYASGAFLGDLLVVRAGVAAREPVPHEILIEIFWDYEGGSGRLAYGGWFWHAAEGTSKSVSDLWVYDYQTGSNVLWLANNVARAAWSPVPDAATGRTHIAAVVYNPQSESFDLVVLKGPGSSAVVAKHVSIEFAWSPGGQQLVFARTKNFGTAVGVETGLYVVSVTAGNETKVSDYAYQDSGWIGDQPVWVSNPLAMIYADSPLGVAPLDGSGDFIPADDLSRPFDMLWHDTSHTLLVQIETSLGAQGVEAWRFSEDLRMVTERFTLGPPGEDVALVGWYQPGEVVLLAVAGGYGEPIFWSLNQNAPVNP